MKLIQKLLIPVFLLLFLTGSVLFNNIESFKRIILYGYKQSIHQKLLDTKYSLSLITKDIDYYPTEKVIISKKNYIKIQNQVSEVFNNYSITGNFFEGTDKYYNVDFFSDKKTLNKGKIKLFGMNPDHFANKSGHSFRAKYNGNEHYGNKIVNYLKPDTRGYGIEYLLNIIYKNQFGGIAINYSPVRLYFNNIDYGFYFKEDFFDKYLIEENSRRDGEIFEVFEDSIKFNHIPETGLSKLHEYIELNSNMDLDEILVEYIDLDKTAAVLSLSIISGTDHPLVDFNLHWYYNPLTNKIEPIYREADVISIKSNNKILVNSNGSQYFNNEDKLSLDKLIQRMSEENYLTRKLFLENQSILEEKVNSNLILLSNIFLNDLFIDYDDFIAFDKLNPTNNGFNKNLQIIKENINTIMSLNIINSNVLENKIDNKKYVFSNKNVISKDLILENFDQIIIPKNAKILLTDDADIIIKNSKIDFNGTDYNKITVSAIGNSNSSIYFDNSQVNINYTHFQNLRNLDKKAWMLPAAITFHKSKVIINSSSFVSNTYGDDYLNFFNCKSVTVTDSSFENVYSDAIDSDFSTIEISNSIFQNIKNDGVDVSGSNLEISNSIFQNVSDKAISVGEKSYAIAKNNKIFNSEMGIVIKDGSSMIDSDSEYFNNTFDIVMFIKKSYFGAGNIVSKNVNYNSNLIDQNIPRKNISINNFIPNLKENVEALLYGNVYGQSTN